MLEEDDVLRENDFMPTPIVALVAVAEEALAMEREGEKLLEYLCQLASLTDVLDFSVLVEGTSIIDVFKQPEMDPEDWKVDLLVQCALSRVFSASTGPQSTKEERALAGNVSRALAALSKDNPLLCHHLTMLLVKSSSLIMLQKAGVMVNAVRTYHKSFWRATAAVALARMFGMVCTALFKQQHIAPSHVLLVAATNVFPRAALFAVTTKLPQAFLECLLSTTCVFGMSADAEQVKHCVPLVRALAQLFKCSPTPLTTAAAALPSLPAFVLSCLNKKKYFTQSDALWSLAALCNAVVPLDERPRSFILSPFDLSVHEDAIKSAQAKYSEPLDFMGAASLQRLKMTSSPHVISPQSTDWVLPSTTVIYHVDLHTFDLPPAFTLPPTCQVVLHGRAQVLLDRLCSMDKSKDLISTQRMVCCPSVELDELGSPFDTGIAVSVAALRHCTKFAAQILLSKDKSVEHVAACLSSSGHSFMLVTEPNSALPTPFTTASMDCYI
jgi:hypothetical protein